MIAGFWTMRSHAAALDEDVYFTGYFSIDVIIKNIAYEYVQMCENILVG